MRLKLGLVAMVLVVARQAATGQDVDGTLGKPVPIDFAQAGATPYESDVGDLYIVSLPAKDVKRVKTDLLPDQGDAVSRVALVRVGDTITAYYSADKVGAAQLLFEVTRSTGGATVVERKIIAVKVNEAQQFNTVHERDLDAPSNPVLEGKVGDVIKVKKKKAGLTSLKCSSANASVARRDSVVEDGDTFVYYFTIVGRGSTTIGASWGAGAGKDGGFILAVTGK
jgi:hypothetical protein